jgi:hypothetical protein
MTGILPPGSFSDPVSGGLTNIVFDIIRTTGGKASEAIRDRQMINKAVKQYAERYRNRYGTVRMLGMQKGIPLEQIYTVAKFLDDVSIRRFESIEMLEQAFRQNANRRLQTQERVSQSGSEVIDKCQYLMVLGGPGAGKSTFLRRVGLEALKVEQGKYHHNNIPILLELKRLKLDEIDILQAITKELENFGFPPSEAFATKALEQGKLLILLDGLDEVPKVHLNQVIEAIQDFVTRYGRNGNRFIASCRIAAYRSSFQGFTDIELADFDDQQIHQFIYNWFRSPLDKETNTAKKCWELLIHPNNKSAKELAQNPLLLTFLCLVYSRSQNLPSNRSSLYRKALDIFLEEWAAEKRVERDTIYQGLYPELEIVLLSEIAYQTFSANQLFFSEQAIIEQITAFLSDTLNSPKYLDGKAVLKAIEIQQGILVERAEDIHSFSHLTLQEYLTAQYIAQGEQRIESIVINHLTDSRWREVFLLVAGSLHNADKLLVLIHQKALTYINTSKLQALLYWSNEITNTLEQNYKPVVKRASAIDLALDLACAQVKTPAYRRVRTLARSLARSLSSDLSCELELIRDLDLAHACASIFNPILDPNTASALDPVLDPSLARARDRVHACLSDQVLTSSPRILNLDLVQLDILQAEIPDKSQSFQIRKSFADELSQAFFGVLRFNSDWLDISDSEAESLANYLYAYELIIACKEASVRVSREIWDVIEQKMLQLS